MNHIPTFVRKGCSLIIIGMLLLAQGGGVAYAEDIVDVVAETSESIAQTIATESAPDLPLALAPTTTEAGDVGTSADSTLFESTGTDTEMLFTTQGTSTEDGSGIVAESATTTATTSDTREGSALSSISETIFSSGCATSRGAEVGFERSISSTSSSTPDTNVVSVVGTSTVNGATSTPCAVPPSVSSSFSSNSSTSSTPDAIADSESATGTTATIAVTSHTDSGNATGTPSTNTASSTEGGPVIVSGKAVAMANILNIVNTNLINSEGSIIFANRIDPVTGEIDFRGSALGASSSCSLSSCSGQSDIHTNLESDAYISNLIDVDASSGSNTIENAEDAVIATGDAYAALNLVNIANMNFVDSRYLLVSLNAFEGINGDIIFPNLDHIFATQGASSLSELNLANIAGINTDLTIDADSGGNATDDNASSTIRAGDAEASSNVFNQINTTLGANDSVAILFRVHGTWTGGLVNAPRGLVSTMNDDGTFLLSTAPTTDELLRLSDNPEDGGGRNVGVAGTSTALIENDVHISARTGDNAIMNAESAFITSGNAYAGANIINVANANVLGRNWILAIVNIFGDFNGDIAFGRPDLWVGERVVTPPPFHNGNTLSYQFTVINNGDAPSSNVRLTDKVDTMHLDILDSSLPYTAPESGLLVWELGNLPPGGAIELTLNVRIKDASPGTEIVNEISVRGHEAESVTANNKDRTAITTYVAQASGSGSAYNNEQMVIIISPRNTENAVVTASPLTSNLIASSTGATTKASTTPLLPLEIVRSTATSSVEDMNVKSPQAIIIRNPNNTKVDSVVFRDILRSPEGDILSTETWDLDTLLPNEEIAIGYDIAFGKNATTGMYILSSTIDRGGIVDAFESNGRIFLNKIAMKPALEIPTKKVAVESEMKRATPLTVSNEENATPAAVSAIVDNMLLLPETAYAANVISSGDNMLGRTKLRGAHLAYFLVPMFVTILYIAMRRKTVR